MRYRESPQAKRTYGVLPSYQKYEDYKDEIRDLENLLVELTQDKKFVITGILDVKMIA
jgi:hypothetical protein